jgi:membrane protease YdiL (CAAX protease family)
VDEQCGGRGIVALAALFEGGLGVLACLIGWLTGLPPWAALRWDAADAGLGVLAAFPLLVLFVLCVRWPVGPLGGVKRFMDEVVRPLFRDCTVADLAVISLLAGVGEELLFRGLIQEALALRVGPWGALAGGALLFGLMHAMTAAYLVLATFAGAYLGWAYLASGNLLVPVVAHGLYDFVALVYLLRGPRPSEGAGV